MREGTMRRGGLKPAPQTPRPAIGPAGQGRVRNPGRLAQALSAISEARHRGAASVPLQAAETLEAALREQQQRAEAMCRLLDEVFEEARRP